MSLYSPWNSPGQNTGVGSRCHFQGIFPTQGLNPESALQADTLPAGPQENPYQIQQRLLKWPTSEKKIL